MNETASIDYTILGARIRHSRERAGLTQQQLGEACSLSTAHIGHVERGTRKLSVETLFSISRALRVSTDYLLAEPDPPGNQFQHVLAAMLDGKDDKKLASFFRTVKVLAENIENI